MIYKMTLDEQMRAIAAELISEHGIHYKISLKELRELLYARFETNMGSVIPSDYCYDRVNRGIVFENKPHLFRFLGNGMYECLGENYPFTGEVENASDGTAAGSWENGAFHKNANWDMLGLK